MKITFSLPTDNNRHRFCQLCHSEEVHDEYIEGKKMYVCDGCGKTNDRLIDIDPALIWWVDPDTNEYWHESVGIFVSNPDQKLLLLERTIYPYGMIVPAGHLERGETPESATKRELWEETGVDVSGLHPKIVVDIYPDLCRRGADGHRWHVYTCRLIDLVTVVPDKSEGKNPHWLSLEDALTTNLTRPVRYLLETYGAELIEG